MFVAANAGGSLAGAARQLGLTAMAASRRLAALEADLGVRLMHRTTRAVALTPEGEEFLTYARTMLEASEEARTLLAPATHGARGLLRVTAPAAFGRIEVMPVIPKLLHENPELRIELQMSDAIVDIVASGFDVAIRVAPLRDSELVARSIAPNPRVLCASPGYISANGKPLTLEDLGSHECLSLANMASWPFRVDEAVRNFRPKGRFVCSSVEGLRTACVDGMGITMLTYWDVREELASGALEVLPLVDALPEDLSIWAVLPTRKYVPMHVRLFLDALEKRLSKCAPLVRP